MSTQDDIYVLMGHIPREEYEKRAKLRSYRNAATAMLTKTHSDTARKLAWEAIEWVSPNLYEPAPLEWLDKVTLLVSRLLKTAITAEELQRVIEEGGEDLSDAG